MNAFKQNLQYTELTVSVLRLLLLLLLKSTFYLVLFLINA